MERLVSARAVQEEVNFERSLRPKKIGEYMGQRAIKENLLVFIEAARRRGEPLDHILLYGAPGMGKTTLALIIANEMGRAIKTTSGPAIERPIDLLVLLRSLAPGDVFFIDEIHRLSRQVEEILYPAMEDFSFDRVLGKGAMGRSARIKLPEFTLIGATTRGGALSSPLRDRFGIVFTLARYQEEELEKILMRSAGILGVDLDAPGSREIARRCRGTPRIANRLLRRARDFAQVHGDGRITREIAAGSLDRMGIDHLGLDEVDRKIIENLIVKFKGRPVGVETLAATVNEEPENLEEVYEPYLLQLGFIDKTPRGRMAAPPAYEYMGMPAPKAGQMTFW